MAEKCFSSKGMDANNVVVVWRLNYIQTLKQELSGTRAYKEASAEENSAVDDHLAIYP